jgi:hypothetical protein
MAAKRRGKRKKIRINCRQGTQRSQRRNEGDPPEQRGTTDSTDYTDRKPLAKLPGFIRAIRAIRGKKFPRKWVALTHRSAKMKK